MCDTNRLRACWVAKGLRQRDVAEIIGVCEKTFCERMKKGVFGSDEIQKMIKALDITDPVPIFFANQVTSQDTQ